MTFLFFLGYFAFNTFFSIARFVPSSLLYATIGEAVNMSNNTVAKHVEGLVRKGMITTERTTVKTRDGRMHNGSLLYTLCPLAPVEQAYFEKQIREASARMNFKAALEKNEKRKGGA